MINVTKTFLPPQEEYQAILKEAWDSGWVTNRGVLVNRLEKLLKEYLNIPNIIAMTNGTLPLQIAIKGLGLKGEIITTPFSYVATTSSIVWEGCTPVFVDINSEFLTIDETKIEAAISPNTSAILATHVFGNPCAVEEIEIIAKKHNLKVIYDAAHSFGVTYKGKSIFEYGDISTCSFHATKLLHTGEGGALICNDKTLNDILFYHHNFGHKDNETFYGLGINGKMSEFQAAMGLSVFPYIEEILVERQRICEFYDNNLKFKNKERLNLRDSTNWNYAYYPIVFQTEEELLKLKTKLEANNIFPRRYFSPSLNTLDYLKDAASCPISESISKRILCLPLFYDMAKEDLELICNIISMEA